MANKKINELSTRTPSLTDLILVGDPTSGYSYKCTVSALATIIETDIADAYVTLDTAQTISGAKTFSNNLTLTSVTNAAVAQDKFLTLNGSNVVNYRTAAQVLSDIGAASASSLSNYVPTTRTLTINGTSYDLSANRSWSVGTVTSVAATAGTGISISGSPITSSGTLTITNTAPDQTVVLTAGTGISVSGTYPNFTITNSSPSSGGTVTSVGLSTGTTGTDISVSGSPITSSGTITLNIPNASATNRGALSSADWSTFNGKQDAITLTTTGSSGSATFVSNTLNIPTYTLAGLGGISLTSLSASSPLSYNSGTGAFSISQSSSSTNGYLSSTDWTTFNNKQNAITLTTTGTSGAATLVGSTLNIPQYQSVLTNPVTGTGTTNYIPKFTSSSAIGNSDLLTDGSGNLAVAQGNTPTQALNIYRAGSTQTVMSAGNSNTGLNGTFFGVDASGNGIINTTGAFANIFSTNGSERMRLDASGNLGLGTSSPSTSLAGAKGLVIYDGSITDQQIKLQNASTGSGNTDGGLLSISGTNMYLWNYENAPLIFGTNNAERMRLDASGNLGLGVTPSAWSLGKAIDISGGMGLLGYNNGSYYINNAYYNAGWFYKTSSTASYYFQANNGEHQWYNAPSGIAGNAISFTQAMTLSAAGNLGINTSSPNIAAANKGLSIDGTTTILETNISGSRAGYLYSDAAQTILGEFRNLPLLFRTNDTERMRISSSGLVGINTSSPSYTLDVQGTVRAFGVGNTGNFLAVDTSVGGATVQLNPQYGTGLPILQSVGSFPLLLGTNGTERARILTTGAIRFNAYGSGSITGTPTYTLAVDASGNIIETSGSGVSGSGTTNYLPKFSASTTLANSRLFDDGTTTFLGNGDVNATPSTGIFSGTGGTGTNIAGAELRIRGGASTGSGAGGVITFYTSAAGTSGSTVNAAAERMRILSNGNVIINNTIGSYPLTVNGGIATTNNVTASTGSLGVLLGTAGTAIGSCDLGFIVADNNGYGTFNDLIISPRNNGANQGAFRVYTSGSERFKINSNGTISFTTSNITVTGGSGTVTPLTLSGGSANLQMRFTSASTDASIYNSSAGGIKIETLSGSNGIYLNGSGNTGLGTTTVGSKLQVNGGAAIGYSSSTAAPTNGLAVAGNVVFGGTASVIANYTSLTMNGANGSFTEYQQAAGNTFRVGADLSDGGFLYTQGNTAIRFGTNGSSERMRITGSGEVQLKPAANTAALTTTGAYSLTGANAQSLIDLAGTWNTTGNPTAIKLNITNTASGATSYLMDLQVGGVTQFRVTKDGAIRTTAPTGGTANDWKLGSRVAATVVLVTTQYIELDIAGTLYKLATVN